MRRAQYNRIRNEKIARFRVLLDKHDWYFHQSGDRRVYGKGLADENIIKSLVEKDYTLNLMYQAKKKKIFG